MDLFKKVKICLCIFTYVNGIEEMFKEVCLYILKLVDSFCISCF